MNARTLTALIFRCLLLTRSQVSKVMKVVASAHLAVEGSLHFAEQTSLGIICQLHLGSGFP